MRFCNQHKHSKGQHKRDTYKLQEKNISIKISTKANPTHENYRKRERKKKMMKKKKRRSQTLIKLVPLVSCCHYCSAGSPCSLWISIQNKDQAKQSGGYISIRNSIITTRFLLAYYIENKNEYLGVFTPGSCIGCSTAEAPS